jgi:alcohol oxidase
MKTYRWEVSGFHLLFQADSKAACVEADAPTDIVQGIEYSAADDATIENWVWENVQSCWDSPGTCKMAPQEDNGVVNPRLNVYGGDGLKVADLSIAPSNISANTYSTALAIGEKAAHIFLQELGLVGDQ